MKKFRTKWTEEEELRKQRLGVVFEKLLRQWPSSRLMIQQALLFLHRRLPFWSIETFNQPETITAERETALFSSQAPFAALPTLLLIAVGVSLVDKHLFLHLIEVLLSCCEVCLVRRLGLLLLLCLFFLDHL